MVSGRGREAIVNVFVEGFVCDWEFTLFPAKHEAVDVEEGRVVDVRCDGNRAVVGQVGKVVSGVDF